MFMTLDINKDGVISYEELLAGFRQLNTTDEYPVQQILQRVDLDKSGQIDFSEFLTAAVDWGTALSEERL